MLSVTRWMVYAALAAGAGTAAIVASVGQTSARNQGLNANGGQVRLDALPSEVLVVGPHGCVVVDGKGVPTSIRLADLADSPGTQIGDADEVTPSTIRPAPADGKEDCSVDVGKAADLVASGISVSDAVRASHIAP